MPDVSLSLDAVSPRRVVLARVLRPFTSSSAMTGRLIMHDHPKRFISIGLRGSYIEQTPSSDELRAHYRDLTLTNETLYRAPWVRTFPASHIHRIRLLVNRKPCWTLVIVLRSVREWGFWHDGVFIPWRDYVKGSASAIADKMRACL
jgi:hypothetical protein